MGKLIQMKNWKATNPSAPTLFEPDKEGPMGKGPRYPIPKHIADNKESFTKLLLEHVKTDPEILAEIARMREKPHSSWNYAIQAKKLGPEDAIWGLMLVEAIQNTDALHEITGSRCNMGIVSYRALQRICEIQMARLSAHKSKD